MYRYFIKFVCSQVLHTYCNIHTYKLCPQLMENVNKHRFLVTNIYQPETKERNFTQNLSESTN